MGDTEAAAPVLVAGEWRPSQAHDWFSSADPISGRHVGTFPISPWSEVSAALAAGDHAFEALQAAGPVRWSMVLERLADRLEDAAVELVTAAHAETGLPAEPRLRIVELPRTVDQLRQAASAARSRSWREPALAPMVRIASYMAPIPGVVAVLGPNNFPFAFNGIGGGDFAAALATGHPILAKANPGHPETTRLLARHALEAVHDAGLPTATVQLLYHLQADDGRRLVADPRLAATAFTGSRTAGRALKAAADEAGRLIYLEMSSINPVVVLPGAWDERGPAIAAELAQSSALASGQFCTSPGIVFTVGQPTANGLRAALIAELGRNPPGPLLGPGVVKALEDAVRVLRAAGAHVAWHSEPTPTGPCWLPTTLLTVDGSGFLARSDDLQREAFGNAVLLVSAETANELTSCLTCLHGNLTGTIYAQGSGSEETLYQRVEGVLRPRVGRLLNDKPPTGVAVVDAMNHGGPYPATGHPGFTAVGLPASLRRFTMLQCFDNVDDRRLPPELQAANPLGLQRRVDGRWTDAPIAWGA